MVLFRLYYLGLAPYENSRHFLGLSEHSWVNWTERIRRRCGKELLSRGMFLPRKYFTSIDWANCRRDHQERWARHCGVLAEPSRSSHQLRQSTTIGFLTLLSHYVACPERRSGAQWPQPKGATMNAFKKLAAKYLFPSIPIIAMFFLCSTGLRAQVLIVDCTGADLSAYPSISAALPNATPGTFILVTGPCTENVFLNGQSGLNLGAFYGQTATINGTISIKNSQNVFLYGLNVTNTAGDGFSVSNSRGVSLNVCSGNAGLLSWYKPGPEKRDSYEPA